MKYDLSNIVSDVCDKHMSECVNNCMNELSAEYGVARGLLTRYIKSSLVKALDEFELEKVRK